MKTRRDWAVLWYAAVLAAAVGWGYAPPAGTEIAADEPAVESERRAQPSRAVELRHMAQHMVLR
jgi:hypothetical protein